MILIDTDVYAIDMIYTRDRRFEENRAFLDGVAEVDKAITIYNLMEIVGKSSFVLNLKELKALYRGFGMTYGVTTLFPRTDDMTASGFLEEILKGSFAKICERMSFLDALILDTAEAYPQVRSFVSWNAHHFEGKTRVEVVTPREWLESRNHF